MDYPNRKRTVYTLPGTGHRTRIIETTIRSNKLDPVVAKQASPELTPPPSERSPTPEPPARAATPPPPPSPVIAVVRVEEERERPRTNGSDSTSGRSHRRSRRGSRGEELYIERERETVRMAPEMRRAPEPEYEPYRYVEGPKRIYEDNHGYSKQVIERERVRVQD